MKLNGRPYRAEAVEEDGEWARLWELADNVFPPFSFYRESAARSGRTIPFFGLIRVTNLCRSEMIWTMGRGLRVALVMLGCLIPVSDAVAEVRMQALLNEDGTGRLFVNNSGEPLWAWEQCQPGPSQCSPFWQREGHQHRERAGEHGFPRHWERGLGVEPALEGKGERPLASLGAR